MTLSQHARADRAIRSPRIRALQRAFAFPTILIPLVGVGVAAVQVWEGRVGRMEIVLLVVMYCITTLSITAGFHRGFTHRAYVASTGVRAAFGVLGSMAALGPVINWVSNHRRHHAFSDRIGDPHSPYITDQGAPLSGLRGLWHAHVGWLFDGEVSNATVFARDLIRDRVIARVNKMYLPCVALGLALPGVVGGIWTHTWDGVWQGILWGGLVRIALNHQALWTIGSFGHIIGRRTFDTGAHEQSRNSMLVNIPLLGEGWHNNHHAFPRAAYISFEWWQYDPTGWVIRALEVCGWIRDVKHAPARDVRASKIRSRLEVSSRSHTTHDAPVVETSKGDLQ